MVAAPPALYVVGEGAVAGVGLHHAPGTSFQCWYRMHHAE